MDLPKDLIRVICSYLPDNELDKVSLFLDKDDIFWTQRQLSYYDDRSNFSKKGQYEIFVSMMKNVDPCTLVDLGVDPTYVKKYKSWRLIEIRDILASEKYLDKLLDVQDIDGRTMLAHCCMYFHQDEVDALLKKGANPNIRDLSGITTLALALFWNTVLVRKLISHGADPHIVDNGGTSMLDIATSRKDIMLIKLLLESGAIATNKQLIIDVVSSNSYVSKSDKEAIFSMLR